MKRSGTINAPIARKEDSIIERTISANGDTAVTHYFVISESNGYSLVRFVLETGRTHQIRVHSKFIEHPILGDTLYGQSSALIGRQALHAYKVELISPLTNRIIHCTAPIPNDIQEVINKLKLGTGL